ncbi:MAG: hydrogen peroxide-inducible genes activator, partial [Gammaproteobacteria bacterium]|nr:hydrogen peroxide-inducible genes activator [Gammaproteobacteria bacterium]
PLLARLEGGELEAALIALPYDTDGLRIETVMEDEFLFACGPAHPLAGRDEVPVEALEGEALLLLEEGHCLRGHALEVCGVGDRRTRAQFEASSLHTLVQMVAAGIGVTLVPRLAVEARILEGTRISLARLGAPASRRIGLAWRRRSGRTEDFQLLAGALRELTDAA